MSNNTLLPPNSTPFERGIAEATARISNVPVPINDLWNPWTCPLNLLPWLAWALNLQTWDSTWPEALKRQQVASAVTIARQKGTAKSVRDVVSSFGSALALREWWETTPKGDPYSFAIVLSVGPNVPQTAEFQQQIMQAVDDAKPVRAHYTLTAGINSMGSIGMLAAGRPVIYRRIEAQEQ
ncbi:hypothetical protein LMG33818_002619 [Halomonadaceae bacterium LMG 33818]|uniref:phage tail protein I n=1 Tax=Cernens ardua TaxID=3402176 RepID=UPI003EDBF70E